MNGKSDTETCIAAAAAAKSLQSCPTLSDFAALQIGSSVLSF